MVQEDNGNIKDNSSNKSFTDSEAANENDEDEHLSKICNSKSKLSSSRRRRKNTNSSKSSGGSREDEIQNENEDTKEPDNQVNINSKFKNTEKEQEEQGEVIQTYTDFTNNNNTSINIKLEKETERIIIQESDAITESLISDSKRVSNASASLDKSTTKSLFHDILSFGFNCRSCFAFNPSENKITEIENTYFKFPAFHSFINIPPFAFIGGGKDSQSKELNSFSKFKRTETKKIELVELQEMNFPRHHHLYVYYKQKQQILCVGGSKLKTCEAYDVSSNSWAVLGELNVSRECPSACVTDQNTLYVFFGFDKNVNKYVSTIEKIELNSVEIDFENKSNNKNNKFEVINVKGNQNILKKHSAAALQIDSGKVLIFGGINSLRNTSKDVLVYDLKMNSGQFFNSSLPVNASFHNCGFVDLNFENDLEDKDGIIQNDGHKAKRLDSNEGNILYNFMDDFKIIRLNTESFTMEIID